jgi:hypothetical protein
MKARGTQKDVGGAGLMGSRRVPWRYLETTSGGRIKASPFISIVGYRVKQ